jgi:hypothetical protein
MTANDKEELRLLNIVLGFATDDSAPIKDMPPISIIVSAISMAVANRHDPDELVAALIGALSWIARERWAEVFGAIQEAAGERLQ